MKSFPKIAHLITDLNGFGGTEATLLRYLKESSIPSQYHRVFVLKSIGEGEAIGAQMVAAGFSVVALNQKRGTVSLPAMRRLYRGLAAFQPDVISGWLYHPSLLSSVFALFLKHRPEVVWHIRSLPFASLVKSPGRFWVQRLLAALSYFSTKTIVSNSHVARQRHAEIGFCDKPGLWTVIPNGLNPDAYAPDREEGQRVRQELDIPEEALLIGCVGRFVPEKGYPVMFEALNFALQKLAPEIASRVYFLAVGNGVDADNPSFREMVSSSIPWNRLRLLGKRGDVSRLLKGVDIFVLPSISEAFPNSLVEAMATEVACLATNVGECAEVLPAAELIVQPGNAVQLGQGIVSLIEIGHQKRVQLGKENRERIVQNLTLTQMVLRFDVLFKNLADIKNGSTIQMEN